MIISSVLEESSYICGLEVCLSVFIVEPARWAVAIIYYPSLVIECLYYRMARGVFAGSLW